MHNNSKPGGRNCFGVVKQFPLGFHEILTESKKIEFDQLSDPYFGVFLSTLCASKANGRFLELGTGTGLSTAWMLHGMDSSSSLKTIDSNESLVEIAKRYLANDQRVSFIVGRGEDLIEKTEANSIDFIFADTWPGKYNHVAETLSLLKIGGIYLIDDMLPQENWPDGHAEKADDLIQYLETRDDFQITKMSWSTGIIICTKQA